MLLEEELVGNGIEVLFDTRFLAEAAGDRAVECVRKRGGAEGPAGDHVMAAGELHEDVRSHQHAEDRKEVWNGEPHPGIHRIRDLLRAWASLCGSIGNRNWCGRRGRMSTVRWGLPWSRGEISCGRAISGRQGSGRCISSMPSPDFLVRSRK